MVSCGAPGCTNRVDKSSNIITLIAIIVMLLKLYRIIFKPLAYLMLEAYSKPCQIAKVMRHIENPGKVRTVYSGIFRDIQPC